MAPARLFKRLDNAFTHWIYLIFPEHRFRFSGRRVSADRKAAAVRSSIPPQIHGMSRLRGAARLLPVTAQASGTGRRLVYRDRQPGSHHGRSGASDRFALRIKP
jgi:hypothetical protein